MNKIINILEEACVWLVFLIGLICYFPGLKFEIIQWIAFSLFAFIGVMEITTNIRKSKQGSKDE